ncbi:MAG: YggS family pyridoxal phosphate-dependent enzyme [Nitrospira sp. CR1.3]|nr:YggS family pyridoxal phosphate-dependent enzyme [Nitrospira sp. CR1.3]
MNARADGSIGDRLRLVLDRIDRAAETSGRGRESIRLVAATKSVSAERIREAIAAGLRFAGENRLQEALPKIEVLRGEPIRWHFIGQLQRRKVRDVVGAFDVIHSVDSLELASEINRRAGEAGLRQAVLLEVNVGGETTKAGFQPDRLEEILPRICGLQHLDIRGLMTIPPPVGDAEQARPYFRRLRELAGRLSHQVVSAASMDELSMGMSNDYTVAIEEGATMVRVGTAIFGMRHE